MNGKNVKSNMQIDVSFVSNATSMVKNLETDFKKLDLSSSLNKNIQTSLNKTFKELYSTLNKMGEGLGRKGLNTKQYTALFTSLNTKIASITQEFGNLGKAMTQAFDSGANKDAIKQLEAYKKILKEVYDMSSKSKAANTRAQTSKSKLAEMGIDLDNKYTSKTLNSMIERRSAGNKSLTTSQSSVLGKNADSEDKIKRIITLVKQYNDNLEKSIAYEKEMQELSGTKGNAETIIANLEKQCGAIQQAIIETDTYNKNMEILRNTNSQLNDVMDLSTILLKDYESELPRATAEAEKMAKANSTIREILGQFGIAFSAASIVRGFQDLAKSAFSFYNSLDSALNQIYVVSNLSSDAVNGLQDNFVNMAKKTGMSIDDVTKSAVLFYQQGLNTNEVLEMTKVTSEFAKVAGIDATDAADKLTAAVNGYCLAATDAINVADKFNKVAAASAADINELSTAFSKAAAQANQAGVSMDNYLAYIATMEEATREAPENIGTSLKTIFSRMQQIKEAGSSEDGETDINKVETALTSVGVALRDDNNQLRDLQDVFAELGPMWNQLDRNTQAYLGTVIAGTRQQSRFITLMQNWNRVMELSEESENSAGQQALMHAKAMDSIESKVQQLSVAWQQFISQLIDSDAIKKMIDMLTKFVNKLNTGNKPITLMATAVGLLANKLKDLQIPLTNKIKDIGNMFNAFKKNGDVIKGSDKRELLSQNKKAQQNQKDIVNKAQETYNEVLAETQKLALTDSQDKKHLELLNKKKQELEVAEEDLKVQRERLNLLKKQGDEIKNRDTKITQIGKGLNSLGVGISSIGLLIAQADDNMGSLVSTIGSGVTAIGQLASGNIIGGLTTAAMTAYQAYNTYKNWDENKMNKIKSSVQAVSTAMNEYTNKSTLVKQNTNLINKYEALAGKVYRTAAEQTELNNVIQEMGDLNDVDVVTDSYGNLSINISQVREELESLIDEQNKLLSSLTKEELKGKDALSSWFHSATREEVADYYDQLIVENRSQYRSLMNGIKDDLTSEGRGISEGLYQEIQSTFKRRLLNEVTGKDTSYLYDQDGIAQSLKNLEESFNDTMKPKDWQYFYSGIETLQSQIDSLTWDDFQNQLDEMFGDWWQSIGLTKTQWLELKGVIEDTVYGSDEFTSYMQRYTDNGSDYQSKKANKEKVGGQLESYENDKLNISQVVWIDSKDVVTDDKGIRHYKTSDGPVVTGGGSDHLQYQKPLTYEQFVKYAKEHGLEESDFSGSGKYGMISNTNGDGRISVTGKYDPANDRFLGNQDDAKKYINLVYDYIEAVDKANQAEKELSSGRGALASTLATSSPEVVNAIKGYSQMFGQVRALDSKGAYATNPDGTAKYASNDVQNKFADIINKTIKAVPDNYSGNEITIFLQEEISKQIDNIDDDAIKRQLENTLTEITGNLQRTSTFTWGGVIDSLDKFSSNLQTVNKGMKELKENGSVSTSTFKELGSVMDGLNFEDIFESFTDTQEGINYINGLCDALENLDVRYDANTGQIIMNAESLKYLQDAQEKAAKGKIKAMINDLAASKAAAEMQVGYIDAQIKAIEAMISYIDLQGDANINTNQMMAKASTEYDKVFGQVADDTTSSYEQITGDNVEWATTTIHNIAKVTEAWSQYWQAVRNGDANASDLYNKAREVSEGYFSDADSFKNATKIDLSGINGLSGNSEQVQNKKKELQAYKTKLEEAKTAYSKNVSLYTGQIKYLQSLYDSDLSQWGSSDSGSGSKQNITKYIGKLKEVLNLERKIATEEDRIADLESYMQYAHGDDWLKYNKERNDLLEEELGNYDKLMNSYGDMLATEQQMIKNSPVGDVFSFDKFGNIIIDYEKYVNLQDESIDGKETLLQLADELYTEYDEMYNTLQEKEDAYLKVLIKRIETAKNQIKKYIDLESKVGEAVKNIYQKMLDDKLEAIDKEVKALDDLKKAYNEANKAAQQSRDVSKLQENLKRSMMDTSGASNTKVLSYRDQIRNKLEEMGQDEYTKRLDGIKESLDDQKETLQNQFNEYFEDYQQMYEMIEKQILGNKDAVVSVLQTTDDYLHASEIERQQFLYDLEQDYTEAMADLGGGKTIYDVWDSMVNNINAIGNLDTHLQSYIKDGNKELANYFSVALENFANSISQTVSNAVKSSGGGSGSGGNGGGNYSYVPSGGGGTSSTYTKKSIGANKVAINADTKFGTFDTVDDNGVKYQPNNVKGDTLTKTGYTASDYGVYKNTSGYNVGDQNIWVTKNGKKLYVWNGTKGIYESLGALKDTDANKLYLGTLDLAQAISKNKWKAYAHGGLADFTGPAWLDGTASAPEAILNAGQTKSFFKVANNLDKLEFLTGENGSSISIDNISFNVESMSSEEDGKKAFNAFIDEFKKIGSQQGLNFTRNNK